MGIDGGRAAWRTGAFSRALFGMHICLLAEEKEEGGETRCIGVCNGIGNASAWSCGYGTVAILYYCLLIQVDSSMKGWILRSAQSSWLFSTADTRNSN